MFTVKEIIEATGGKLISGKGKKKVSAVSIDSRTVKAGQLFVAIKGKNFDGHSFIPEVSKKGAGAILFSNPRYKNSTFGFKSSNLTPLIKVNNTVRALGHLAHYHRASFKIPVIAITGSNGKTTTKEMLSSILKTKFNVLCNPDTENNYIGVPLAVLGLRKAHNLAVLEIGANHAGEVDWLSWILEPTVGIITNIAPSHLEFFKTLKGVFKAKIELIKNLSKNGKLIINKDDRFLSQLNGKNLRTITFGINRSSNFSGQVVEQREEETIFLLNKRHCMSLKALGRHNVYNALASIACARTLGLNFDKIKEGLASFKMPPLRMQMIDVNNIKIIKDCYNANPQSFNYALDFLKNHPTSGRKIAVCGDMLELGKPAERLHVDLGKRIAKSKIDFLVTVGQLAKKIAEGAYLAGMPKRGVRSCRDCLQAGKFLYRFTRSGDMVLIKGSRGMKMENVVECFTNSFIH
ncbi:MAG: UDP-N-acetylmuramoyl-tripeptide--D-alanyl-D-alanine ligase [Candidatus Omnitrophica bacterium]|nr:UDP-N-acetylmuramoyl-tripeptide--D-alanyl-D-alanine ligase [Candidatus Omnitrophota bacterium]